MKPSSELPILDHTAPAVKAAAILNISRIPTPATRKLLRSGDSFPESPRRRLFPTSPVVPDSVRPESRDSGDDVCTESAAQCPGLPSVTGPPHGYATRQSHSTLELPSSEGHQSDTFWMTSNSDTAVAVTSLSRQESSAETVDIFLPSRPSSPSVDAACRNWAITPSPSSDSHTKTVIKRKSPLLCSPERRPQFSKPKSRTPSPSKRPSWRYPALGNVARTTGSSISPSPKVAERSPAKAPSFGKTLGLSRSALGDWAPQHVNGESYNTSSPVKYDVEDWLHERGCYDVSNARGTIDVATKRRASESLHSSAGSDLRNLPTTPAPDSLESLLDSTSFQGEGVELPPSPSPSSQQHVPWTTTRDSQIEEDVPLCPLGGSAFYNGNSTVPHACVTNGVLAVRCAHDVIEGSFKIEIDALVHLVEKPYGGYALELPGLPAQRGDGKGTIQFTLSNAHHGYDERLRHFTDDWKVEPLEQGRLVRSFRLDEPVTINFLLYEETHVMDAKQLAIEYEIIAATKEDGREAVTTYTALCAVKSLDNFAFWAHDVSFTLFVHNGPVGVYEAFFDGDERHLSLTGDMKRGRPAKATLTCPVQDLPKPIVLSWKADRCSDMLLPQLSLQEVCLTVPDVAAMVDPWSPRPMSAIDLVGQGLRYHSADEGCREGRYD